MNGTPSGTSAKPYLMLIGSMLIFGSIGIFRRSIPLSSGTLACVRGLMGALVLSLFVKLRGGRIRHGIGIRKLLLLAGTGGIIGLNWILLFETYRYTSVAVATICYYMQPAIVILLSPLLLKERLTARKLLCILVSILGIVLITGTGSGGNNTGHGLRGILYGLGAAVLYAGVVIGNKKVQIDDIYEKTILQLLAAGLILVPYVLITERPGGIPISFTGIGLTLTVGIVHTGLAYLLYFGSLPFLPARSVAVLGYLDPVSAFILAAVFLAEPMTWPAAAGAVLIIGSALVSELAPAAKTRPH